MIWYRKKEALHEKNFYSVALLPSIILLTACESTNTNDSPSTFCVHFNWCLTKWLVEAFFVIINLVEFMDGSLIGGGAYDYFVSIPHKTWKAKNFLTVFQALSLMIAFATLMILVINTSNKKWPFSLARSRSFWCIWCYRS